MGKLKARVSRPLRSVRHSDSEEDWTPQPQRENGVEHPLLFVVGHVNTFDQEILVLLYQTP